MSISFQPYVHDAATDMCLIPYAARQDPDAFEINVSNANGSDLLLESVFPALMILVCLRTASLSVSRPTGMLPSQASYQSGRSSRFTIGTL